MIVFIVLILVNLVILQKTREPDDFVEVKERYRILREHLKETGNEKFSILVKPIPITGLKRMTDNVGYNTNKGGEIAVCLDGDVNHIFHVLIHELAHSTVEEYSHSPQFWENFAELRDICEHLGIYRKIADKTKFCGQHIQDK
jgi:predicted metal-dependent hydrolase